MKCHAKVKVEPGSTLTFLTLLLIYLYTSVLRVYGHKNYLTVEIYPKRTKLGT